MGRSPEIEWDDFERRINEALVASSQGIQPPDWVWQRIVHDATNPNRVGGHIKRGDEEFLASSGLVELVT